MAQGELGMLSLGVLGSVQLGSHNFQEEPVLFPYRQCESSWDRLYRAVIKKDAGNEQAVIHCTFGVKSSPCAWPWFVGTEPSGSRRECASLIWSL